MIHIISGKATVEEVADMLMTLKTYIKVAVDVRRRVLAGGGAMHADCESVLLDAESQQRDIWGANWYPESREIEYQSLINIRPRRGNRSMIIVDPALREAVAGIIKERLESG